MLKFKRDLITGDQWIEDWNICYLGGSSGSSSPSTTTTTTQPWSGAQPYFTQIYQDAQNAYGQVNPAPYSGPVYAQPNATQTTANTNLLNLANSPTLTSAANNENNFLTGLTSGQYLNPASNPTLQPEIAAAEQPLVQQFQEQTLPSLNSAAISEGAYGGARNGLAEGRAAQGLATAESNTAANLTANNYNTAFQGMLNAPQAITATQTSLATPANIESAVGGQQQGWSQDAINAAINQYNAAQLAPFTGLSNYAALIGSGGGTNSSTQYSPSTATTPSDILQGVGGLGALGYLGYLALSDRRAKENIKEIGKAYNGLSIYSFNYKGSPVTQLGFMADEVKELHPDAVTKVGDLDYVDYERAVL